MKACDIYRTKKEYKIVTMYHTDTGTYISNKPIFILSLDADIEDINRCIFDSLKASEDIPYPKKNFSKELLIGMREISFKSLYKNSTNCNVYFDGSTIEIQPNRRMKQYNGLEPVVSDLIKISYSEDKELDITKKIIKALEHEYA